jgi:hypothetical protein
MYLTCIQMICITQNSRQGGERNGDTGVKLQEPQQPFHLAEPTLSEIFRVFLLGYHSAVPTVFNS